MSESKQNGDPTALTTVDHWDAAYQQTIRMRLPSPLLASTRDFQRKTRHWVKPGSRVLEIGFAPGKQLAWIASELRASAVAPRLVCTGRRR